MTTPDPRPKTTESPNPRSADLDTMDAAAVVRLMNDEDRGIAEVVGQQAVQITRAVERIAGRLRAGGRLLYCGAGTSGRLGMLDAAECRPTFSAPAGQVIGLIAGGERAMLRAVEGAEDDEPQGRADIVESAVNEKDCVVGISASGSTPYVLGGLAQARELGAATVAIVCNHGSPIAAACDLPIEIVVGAEVLTGSTRLKAGTATKMVLNMLSTGTFVQLHKVYRNYMVDLQASNEKLRQRSVRIVRDAASVEAAEAERSVEACGGDVKRAIVTLLRSCDPQVAASLLEQADGSVRAVVDSSD